MSENRKFKKWMQTPPELRGIDARSMAGKRIKKLLKRLQDASTVTGSNEDLVREIRNLRLENEKLQLELAQINRDLGITE